MTAKKPTLKEIIKGILLEYSENGNILYFHYDQVAKDIADNIEAKSKEEAEERYIIACRKIPMYFGHSEKKDIKEVVKLAAFGKEGER